MILKLNALEQVRFLITSINYVLSKYSLLALPPECIAFYPPLPLDCMTVTWLNASCLAEGHHYPPKLSGDNKTFVDSINLLWVLLTYFFMMNIGYHSVNVLFSWTENCENYIIDILRMHWMVLKMIKKDVLDIVSFNKNLLNYLTLLCISISCILYAIFWATWCGLFEWNMGERRMRVRVGTFAPESCTGWLWKLCRFNCLVNDITFLLYKICRNMLWLSGRFKKSSATFLLWL